MQFVFAKNSLMFNGQDIKDFVASVKWFVPEKDRAHHMGNGLIGKNLTTWLFSGELWLLVQPVWFFGSQ